MDNNNFTASVMASATITNKPENQDSHALVEKSDTRAMFVADGLGAFKYSKLSSEKVIEYFKDILSQHFSSCVPDLLLLGNIFKTVKLRLVEFSNSFLPEEEKGAAYLFGTTAIAVVETEEKISIAYTGNGAAWHIRGNFSEFPDSLYYPWCISNYLNPHSVSENGREVLYKFISDRPDHNESAPSIIEIEKDRLLGDIIMVCTDGIYSADQLRVGENEKGVWVKFESPILCFFEYLASFFKNYPAYSNDALETELIKYLEGLKSNLNDDATVAVLITRDALKYHEGKNNNFKSENTQHK